MKFVKLLVNSWINSLKFLLPQNLLNFILLTIKAIKEVFLVINNAKIELLGIALMLIIVHFDFLELGKLFWILALSIFTWLLLTASRPSIDYKSQSYFNSYGAVETILNIILVFALYIPYLILNIQYNTDLNNLIITVKTLRQIIMQILLFDELYLNKIIGFGGAYFSSPLIIFIGLFMLDSKKTFKEQINAIGRAFLMFIYNYPFCFIIFNFLRLIILVINTIASYILPQNLVPYPVTWYIFLFIVFPFYVIFLVNFYIKQVHDKFSLYYSIKAKS